MSSLKVEVEAKVSPTAKVEQPIPILANSIPIGGSKGQVLTKKSGKPYDVAWENPKGGEGGGDIIVEGVTEERVEEIVSEKTADLQPKTDESLETESKEIVGAINELHNREDKQGLTEEQVKEIVKETAVTKESDPTVPNWAKQDEKPTYTYEEITQKPDLVEDIGSSLAKETNVLTIELKDKSGKVIASTEVAIPKGEVPDLSAYVKNTDYANYNEAGIVYTPSGDEVYNGGVFAKNGVLMIIGSARAGALSDAFFNNPQVYSVPILSKDLYRWIRVGLVQNTETLTDEEKTSACDWLGAAKVAQNINSIPSYSDTIYARHADGTIRMAAVDAGNGLALLSNGNLIVSGASNAQIIARERKPLMSDFIDFAVTEVLTNYKGTAWTDEQKAKARALLGIE